MESFNWVYSIPLAAIIGGITLAIFAIYFKTKKDIAGASGSGVALKAVEDNAQVNGRSWRDWTRSMGDSRPSRAS